MRAWRRAAIAASGGKRMVTVTLTGVASGESGYYINWNMTVVETGKKYDKPGVVTLEQGTKVEFVVMGREGSMIILNGSFVGEMFYTMTVEQDITVNAAARYGGAILDITTADYTP